MPFGPVLDQDEGGEYFNKIYAIEDPEYWCLWQTMTRAINYFRGEDIWRPSPGLLAHQLEWRVVRRKSIYGNEVKLKGHNIGLGVLEEYLKTHGIIFTAQFLIKSGVKKSKRNWDDYMATSSVNKLTEDILPGLVQYAKKGSCHIEFLEDLSEKTYLRSVAGLGYSAVRATTLSDTANSSLAEV